MIFTLGKQPAGMKARLVVLSAQANQLKFEQCSRLLSYNRCSAMRIEDLGIALVLH